MKIKSLLTTIALSALSLSMSAQSYLSFGDYDDYEGYSDYDEDYAYDGSAPDYGPINFYYTNSGCQTILLKNELTSIAGKNITSLGIKMFDTGTYAEYTVPIKVYITETSASTYEKNSNNKRLFFDVKDATLLYDDEITFDGVTYGYMFHDEIVLEFDKPFYYSGDNNLVVTIIASTDETTDGGGYINTYYVDGMTDRTLTCCSDSKTFDDMLAGDRNSSASGYSCGLIDAPMMALGYEDAAAPVAAYKTFVAPYDIDFSGFGSLNAYKASAASNSGVTLEEVTSVKKGEAVILKTNIQPSFTTGTATSVGENSLIASDGTAVSDGTFYCLATIDGVQAFYKVAAGVTIPKGKAYVVIAGGSSAKVAINVDEATAITTVNISRQKSDAVYNLQGQRTTAQKGIFIVGGKKIIKK